jgi:hypothetical protein
MVVVVVVAVVVHNITSSDISVDYLQTKFNANCPVVVFRAVVGKIR